MYKKLEVIEATVGCGKSPRCGPEEYEKICQVRAPYAVFTTGRLTVNFRPPSLLGQSRLSTLSWRTPTKFVPLALRTIPLSSLASQHTNDNTHVDQPGSPPGPKLGASAQAITLATELAVKVNIKERTDLQNRTEPAGNLGNTAAFDKEGKVC